MTTDKDCIFCQIIDGTIPSKKAYEDDQVLAFLDITPESPGHTLVIPKDHSRWLWDMDTDTYNHLMNVSKKIANAQRQAFDNEWIIMKVIGDEVPHTHIHLFPGNQTTGDKTAFDANLTAIKTHL